MFENKTNYAVVKFAKLKTTGEMAASAAHNFRKEQPDNADPAKAYLNEELIKLESQDYIDAYKNKLAEQNIQPKKGCIKALEVMMTFTGKQYKTGDEVKIDALYILDENGNQFFYTVISERGISLHFQRCQRTTAAGRFKQRF